MNTLTKRTVTGILAIALGAGCGSKKPVPAPAPASPAPTSDADAKKGSDDPDNHGIDKSAAEGQGKFEEDAAKKPPAK